MPANKKTPIRRSTLRAHKRVAAEAMKKNIFLEEAIAQMNAGKYGQASAALKQLLATNPDNLEARRLFATLHLKLGSLMTAKTAFESLAQEAVQRQDYWLAESLLKEYLAAGPRCVPFLELLGYVYEEKGDPVSAVVEYGKAIEVLVEDPDPDQPNKAADLFAKIKELAPTGPVVRRFAPVFGAATTFTFVAAETTAEVKAPPAPTDVTEPTLESTESASTEVEEVPAPAEPESSAERDPLLPSLQMAPEVEAPSPEARSFELLSEPAAPSVQDTMEPLPPLPPELLAELGLPELPDLPESEAAQPSEPVFAETREVDPILPSVELAPAVEVEAPPSEPASVSEPVSASTVGLSPETDAPELAATGESVQADPLLPSLEVAPAVEAGATPPWQAPPPEPTLGMDRLAESAVQEAPAAGEQFMGEAEASMEAAPVPPSFELAPTGEGVVPPPEPARVLEPAPALEPPASTWQPVWQDPPPDPVKAMQLGPELAVAGTDQAVGEVLAPPRRATRFRIPKGYSITSLARRLARQVAHVSLRVSLFIRGCFAAARFLALSFLAAVTGTLVLVVLCVGAVSLQWLNIEEKPNSAMYSLTKAPSRSIHDPKRNGYLLLLGFGASSTRDPVQAGYEATLTRSEKGRVNLCLNDGVESASPLRFETTTSALSRWFRTQDPAAYIQTRTSQVRNWIARHEILMSRYRQWLGMPFDDWGFGELGTPDCAQILVAHRLHVAEGFAQDMEKGVGRLEGDLTAWRAILAQAKTLSIKMMAAEAIDDDVAVVSGLLARSDLPMKLLPNLAALGRPLDEVELSLRWPMQNQLVLEAKAVEAGLKTDGAGERPLYQLVLMQMPLPKQRTLNRYASYYEAMIKSAEIPRNRLPKRYDFVRTPPQTFGDYFMNPIDNLLAIELKPDWEEYNGRILETDAFLRLAGLQARIRKPPQESDILARVARAGQGFYDPFTGFPMLLNAKKGKLYSVGKNGKDDDGDPKLDVTVSVAPQSP